MSVNFIDTDLREFRAQCHPMLANEHFIRQLIPLTYDILRPGLTLELVQSHDPLQIGLPLYQEVSLEEDEKALRTYLEDAGIVISAEDRPLLSINEVLEKLETYQDLVVGYLSKHNSDHNASLVHDHVLSRINSAIDGLGYFTVLPELCCRSNFTEDPDAGVNDRSNIRHNVVSDSSNGETSATMGDWNFPEQPSAGPQPAHAHHANQVANKDEPERRHMYGISERHNAWTNTPVATYSQPASSFEKTELENTDANASNQEEQLHQEQSSTQLPSLPAMGTGRRDKRGADDLIETGESHEYAFKRLRVSVSIDDSTSRSGTALSPISAWAAAYGDLTWVAPIQPQLLPPMHDFVPSTSVSSGGFPNESTLVSNAATPSSSSDTTAAARNLTPLQDQVASVETIAEKKMKTKKVRKAKSLKKPTEPAPPKDESWREFKYLICDSKSEAAMENRLCPLHGCPDVFKRSPEDLSLHLKDSHHTLYESTDKCPLLLCATPVHRDDLVDHLLEHHIPGPELFVKGDVGRRVACLACKNSFSQWDGATKHLQHKACYGCMGHDCHFKGNSPLARRDHELDSGHRRVETRGAPRTVVDEDARVKKRKPAAVGGGMTPTTKPDPNHE